MRDISPSLPEKMVWLLVQTEGKELQSVGIQYSTWSLIVTAVADTEYEDVIDPND